MSKFHVKDSFALTQKNWFVLRGTILESEIKPGMEVAVRFNTSVSMTAPIHSIEFARASDGAVVCLCIECADSDELELWKGLGIENETVEISGTSTSA